MIPIGIKLSDSVK